MTHEAHDPYEEPVADPADEAAPDPFKLDDWAAPPDFLTSGGITRTPTHVRARLKPPKDKFFRVHPYDVHNMEWCMPVSMFEYSQSDDDMSDIESQYFVKYKSAAYRELVGKLRPALIVTNATRNKGACLGFTV